MSLYGVAKIHMDNFVPLFFPSVVLGLMPCCPNPYTSKLLLAYSVIIQTFYRALYIFILTKYIGQYSDMDLPLIALLCTVCLFKACCSASHVLSLIQSRSKFLELILSCYKEDITKNRYSLITLIGLAAWPVPLIWRQTIHTEWASILYAAGGVFDIVCVFVIAMQYCTLLEISTKRFAAAKFSLFIQVYKIETATDLHSDILNFTRDIHSIYGRTMLVEICYLGFDFIVAFYDALQSVRLHGQYLWGVCTLVYSMGCIITIYVVCNACERVGRKVGLYHSNYIPTTVRCTVCCEI